jgi:hypothetical protein
MGIATTSSLCSSTADSTGWYNDFIALTVCLFFVSLELDYILLISSCYKVGANMSNRFEWFLIIKKDGSKNDKCQK